MFVCEYCVLSGRGLCDEMITRPEESYRMWCVVVCDLEKLKNEEAMTLVGSQRHRKKKCRYRHDLGEGRTRASSVFSIPKNNFWLLI